MRWLYGTGDLRRRRDREPLRMYADNSLWPGRLWYYSQRLRRNDQLSRLYVTTGVRWWWHNGPVWMFVLGQLYGFVRYDNRWLWGAQELRRLYGPGDLQRWRNREPMRMHAKYDLRFGRLRHYFRRLQWNIGLRRMPGIGVLHRQCLRVHSQLKLPYRDRLWRYK